MSRLAELEAAIVEFCTVERDTRAHTLVKYPGEWDKDWSEQSAESRAAWSKLCARRRDAEHKLLALGEVYREEARNEG